jgi:anthranilate synthase/aminodeoxychorismate synthase-like glutamine amidotransferase
MGGDHEQSARPLAGRGSSDIILLVDNYDSFTYNLYQLLSVLGADVEVRRNDEIIPDELARLAPEGIVISPGPGTPKDAGTSCDLVMRAEVPVLGVCLGLQCVGAAFGGRVVRAPTLMHGKISLVHHCGEGIFAGLTNPVEAVRYHSLAVDRASLPDCLEIIAETEDRTIMGLRHRERPIEGVQFHPESVLTREGPQLVGNFLRMCRTVPVGTGG